MSKRKGGIINRLIMGSEKSEGYARASLPSNRWELFWDIVKGRFGKLVLINVLVAITFIPFFVLLFFNSTIVSGYGMLYPFAQSFGVGYQAPASMIGVAESIEVSVTSMVFLFIPLAFMIASIGISGGAYVIKNMVWTEGIFVANDYWQGIKKNIKYMLLIAIFYSIIFYASEMILRLSDMVIATGSGPKWLFVVIKVITYGEIIFTTIMCFHMITMTETYELKFWQLLKNSFLFTIGLFPHNIFFLAISALPFLLLLSSGFLFVIGIFVVGLLAFSFVLLVWTDFSQWAYDKFINDKIPGAKKNRGIYEKVGKGEEAAAIKKYREQMTIYGNSTLSSRPIKPITDDELQVAELPQSFNRADIEKLNESKKVIYEDNERYIEEHKNDERYQKVEIEKTQEDIEREKRIEKAKKELSKRKKK